MKLKLLLAGACIMFCLCVQAAPRSESQMRSAAIKALNHQYGPSYAPSSNAPLLKLVSNVEYSVFGYEKGGFAVVAADDLLPEVLGYSDKVFDPETPNNNFRWWLEMVSEVSRQAKKSRQAVNTEKPDTTRFPTAVPTLMRSEWGQMDPYWNFCPVTSDTCVVGCVATAMAQIIYYHRNPTHGEGSHSMTVNGKTYTADFGNTTYDYDNMLDFYATIPYTQEQADAAALLSFHCGVAVDMDYDPDGSGAYSQDAATALKRYFGYDKASYESRWSYSEKSWMDMLYDQLSKGWPVYYSGSDPDPVDGGGHAFVIDGYDEQGRVSVNWGWYGSDNGYFNIALLDPFTYSFNQNQGAIIDIRGDRPYDELLTAEVELSTPGSLETKLDPSRIYDYGTLIVSGPINGTDLKLIRDMCGSAVDGYRTKGNLEVLDLRNANIVSGGDYYLTDNGQNYFTAKNEIPERAFYNCRTLKQLFLPESITTIRKGAFALCNRLDTIYVPTGDDKNYLLEGPALFDKNDTTLLISVLPTAVGTFEVKKGTTVISDYGLAGCTHLHEIILPSSLTSIGHYGFYQSNGLMKIRCYSREPVSTGGNLFKGIRSSACYLYVPAGSKEAFSHHSEWGFFATYSHIIEFGSAVKARNAGRDYGEPNPVFGYQISGERPNGVPELSCDAQIDSPVGEYVIHVDPGTITDEIVEFIDGTLKVWKATLKVSVPDYTRYVGQENPEFELTYDGFKLDETPDVLTVLPVATTTATIDSPEGEYPITISGGEAQNYDFRYYKGLLKVVPDPSGVTEIHGTPKPSDSCVFTLDGCCVAKGLDNLSRLPKGVYIISGKKFVVR